LIELESVPIDFVIKLLY